MLVGGVTQMDGFLEHFFKKVYRNKKSAHENNYCKYNNQELAAFTSSLYLAGLVSSLVASPVTRNYGRRASIIAGGVSFFAGAALNGAAINMAMLLLGRILLGVGIGFGNQVFYFFYFSKVFLKKIYVKWFVYFCFVFLIVFVFIKSIASCSGRD